VDTYVILSKNHILELFRSEAIRHMWRMDWTSLICVDAKALLSLDEFIELTLNIGVDGVAPFRVGVGVLVLFADGFGVFVELVPGVTGGVAAWRASCCCWAWFAAAAAAASIWMSSRFRLDKFILDENFFNIKNITFVIFFHHKRKPSSLSVTRSVWLAASALAACADQWQERREVRTEKRGE